MTRAGFVIAKPAVQGDGVFFLTHRGSWDTDFAKARLFSKHGHAALSPAIRFSQRRTGAEIREVTITLA